MKSINTAIVVVAASFLLNACVTTKSDDVMVSHSNDKKKTCHDIGIEMSDTYKKIRNISSKKNSITNNVRRKISPEIGGLLGTLSQKKLGFSGGFATSSLISKASQMFLNPSNSDLQEYEAYRQRYSNLTKIGKDKGCNLNVIYIPQLTSPYRKNEDNIKITIPSPNEAMEYKARNSLSNISALSTILSR